MSARDAEDMANAMLRDSPLPDTERSDEKLPEDDGGGKLPEGNMMGRSFPRGTMISCLKRPLQVNLHLFLLKKSFLSAINLIK